jgi:amino acid adenylation domain-containing protein/thioester reductase-like protein
MADQAHQALTHAQQRILHGEMLHAGTNFANLAVAFQLPVDLNLDFLEQGINAVIENNDAFRLQLIIDKDSGLNVQSVTEFSHQPIPLSEFAAEEGLNEWIRGNVDKPFALDDQPLFRIMLARCPGRLTLLFIAHHVICDNGSLFNFMRQVLENVSKIQAGREIATNKTSYFDYLETEKAYMQSEECNMDRAFWHEKFAELPEYSAIYGKEITVKNIASKRVDFFLPPSLAGRLGDYCQDSKASYFRVFAAAFAVWLARCTGRYDMVLGVPFHNRLNEESKDSLGNFVSTMPLRVQLTEQDTFAQALAKVASDVNEAIEHQRYPFDLLFQELNQKHGKLDQMMEYFLVQSSIGKEAAKGCGVEVLARSFSPEPFVVYLNQGLPDKDGLQKISIEYQTDKYTAQEVTDIYDCLLLILTGAIDDPAQTISRLSLVSALERDVLLHEFNDNALEVPFERSYHGLFREQARSTPENVALVFKNETYTYRQLDERTDSLAIMLRENGVGRETIVPIMMERSAEMVIAAIAIMKAGGAYLPLDIKYPQARLDYMLEDSNATLILSQLSLKDKFSQFGGKFIDIKDEDNYPAVDAAPQDISDGDSLAAVIYTSGSTGLPKGTMIEHRGLINMFYSENRDTGLTAADRLGSYASFSFDASMWSNFSPLLAGAAVYLVPDEIMLSLVELNQFLEDNKITVTFLTTQLCEQFAELVENKSLRLMATGGEKYKTYRPTPYRIVNAYGPTEYTIYTTRFNLDKQYDNIPIGKPLANTWVYVLDKNLQLLPMGVPGELCIAGVQMARGYRNREELTAEKFIANPYATGELNQRLYRTGDLVNWQPDGNLLYLGRIDQQVKIRGFRIELGEIEQKLTQYDGVKAAVVVARDDAAGNKYLCGYFVADHKVDLEKLKALLLESLPYFMIPQNMMQMEALPLTANGKVDKKALPEITGAVAEYVAPRNETEKQLCDLWQDILGVQQVGITDTFNSLGGTSLKLVMLGAKLQKFFAVSISVAELTKIPTVTKLAERLLLTPQEAGSYEAIPVLPAADTYPVSPAQKGMYIIDQMADIGNTYHVVLPIYLEGRLNKERLGQAIDKLVERHPALRTSFVMSGGDVRQKISAGVRLKKTFKVVEEQAIDQAIADFIHKFDLGEAPLLRVALLEIKQDRHMLVLDAHHIVVDGVSVVVLIKELMKLYENEELPPVAVTYPDYADWYNRKLERGDFAAKEAFWLDRLQGELPVLNMTTDFPRPANKKYQGEKIFADIDKGTAEKLKALAEEQGVTFFALLMAAFKTLLARYSGQEEIVIGSPFANRTHPDVDSMIGMFVNTLPLRTYPGRDKLFRDYLQEVNEMLLSANENQNYPFEKMVEKLGIARDGSRNPIYDVVFAYFVEEFLFDADGLSIKRYNHDEKVAHFDLLFYVFENQQGLSLYLEYDRNLYKQHSGQRLVDHYVSLLRVLVNFMDGKLSEIDFTPAAERDRLLYDFNANELDVPFEQSYHSLFREQARRTPDNVALVFKNDTYTYRQLDERTDSLAVMLRENGVGREMIVPIMLERSAEMVIAAIAVMKAGGAYLPLDIKYPQARLDYMLEDSNATMILSQLSLKDKFSQFAGKFIDIRDEANYPVVQAPPPDISAGGSLAAIIYTSGSTGLPKGTMIVHRGLINMFYSENRDTGLTAADRLASYASFSFDASMWSNFSPLLTGAAVYLVPDEILLSLMELNQFFEDNKITVTFMTTQLCEQFAELVENKSLRLMSTGGEKYKTYRPTPYQIVNAYGPTEYTIYTTRFNLDKQYDNIPIGKPLANTKVYVTDKDYNLQPLGVPGELCVAGPQLARGYRNREDLTAEKFIPNPYGTGEIYGRMYRTGDLVRWLPDGNLEFLSRIDGQVKIRGFRIEIGEIEQNIQAWPTARDVVVVARDDASGNRYLCSYFTAEDKVDLEQLKEFMSVDLPGYMIPAHIRQIEVMPLTANGKIDKKALPETDTAAPAGEFVMPSTEIEQKIAEVWQQVLGIEKVSATDNFFSIGGNSIKAISAVAKLQKFFAISINDLFNYPVLRKLAENIKPAEDTLKVRLAEIKQQAAELDKPLSDNPRFKAIYAASMAAYEAENASLRAVDLSEVKGYKNVLVTGATGYLGAHIAHCLLTRRDCIVQVIVRAGNVEEARARLKAKFDYYFGKALLENATLNQRLVVLCGELHHPQIGQTDAVYKQLCADVDAIFHSAANVRHYGHYNEFYESNVQATLELLALAQTGVKKDFHHISTMSVAMGEIAGCEYHVFTEYQTDLGQKSGNYYVETKLESEKVVIAARQQGLNTSIYRAGNIAFQENTGLFQENLDSNAFYNSLKGFINVGMVPNMLDRNEFSYVDRLAEAVVRLGERPALQNQTYHMQNPNAVKISKVLTDPALGLNVKAVDVAEFFDYLYENIEQPGFKEHVENILTDMGLLGEESKIKTASSIALDKTVMVLERVGFAWPAFKAENLRPMVESALKERVDAMKNNQVLGALDREALFLLAGKARLKRWKRREEIIWEGQDNPEVYLILKGFAQLLRSSVGGWQGMVGMAKKNDFIGLELASVADKSSFTAEATMGDTLVLALPRDFLRERGLENPEMLLKMMAILCERIDKLSRLVVSLG